MGGLDLAKYQHTFLDSFLMVLTVTMWCDSDDVGCMESCRAGLIKVNLMEFANSEDQWHVFVS